MKIKITLFVLLSFCASTSLLSQSGGNSILEFLNLTHSARSTALAGGTVSIFDSDVALAYANPALLNESMHSDISINQNFHFADISHGFFSYGHHFDKYKITSHIGINYIDYGTFIRADEFGERQGEFDAGALALTLGGSKALNERINLGINLKLISTRLESFTTSAIATDIGLLYNVPEQKLSFGFSLKNVGVQLTNFSGFNENLPLDIQIGISKRFKYLPFRFSVVAHRLQQWSLRFEDPQANQTSAFGEPIQQDGAITKFTDNFFRHFIFNGEFFIGKTESFKLRFGYNHLRRKELAVSTFRSLGGFSLGFGVKIKKFRVDYGVGYYHLAGGVNHLSISTNLHELTKKF